MKVASMAVLAGLLASGAAWAGNEGGHGGGSVVCYGAQGSLRSAELLDLWEMHGKGGLMMPESEPAQKQLDAALAKYAATDPVRVALMRKALGELTWDEVGGSERIAPPVDTGLRRLHGLEDGCALVGVADFDDVTGFLAYDSTIRRGLGERGRAALEFHEALFKVIRDQSGEDVDSLEARVITGLVFSALPVTQAEVRLETARRVVEAVPPR
jgi:hypothetical protein